MQPGDVIEVYFEEYWCRCRVLEVTARTITVEHPLRVRGVMLMLGPDDEATKWRHPQPHRTTTGPTG